MKTFSIIIISIILLCVVTTTVLRKLFRKDTENGYELWTSATLEEVYNWTMLVGILLAFVLGLAAIIYLLFTVAIV